MMESWLRLGLCALVSGNSRMVESQEGLDWLWDGGDYGQGRAGHSEVRTG